MENLSIVTRALPRKHHPELERCPEKAATGSQAVLRATRIFREVPILEEEGMFSGPQTLSPDREQGEGQCLRGTETETESCHRLPLMPLDPHSEVLSHSASS